MQKGERLRAQINSPVFYRIMNAIFAILFSTALLLAIVTPVQYYISVAWFWIVLSVAAGVLFWLLYYWLISKIPMRSEKSGLAVITVLIVPYFALLLYIANMLTAGITSVSALGDIYHYAEQFAIFNTQIPAEIVYSGENVGFYVFLAGLFSVAKYFGATNFVWVSIVMNAVFICTAIVLFYSFCNAVFGAKKAVMAFIAMLLFFPMIFHAPVLTPASVALPVPILLALLWLKARKNWRNQRLGKVVTKFIFISLITALTAIVLPIIVFLWVAIFIDLFILLSGKGKVRVFLAGAAIGGAALFLLNWSAVNSSMLPNLTEPLTTSLLSQFLMGIQGSGTYRGDVFGAVYLKAQETGSSIQAQLVQAIQQELGSANIFQLWGNKLSSAFSDPTFGTSVALSMFSPSPNAITEIALASGNNFFATYLAAFSLYGGLFIWMIVGAVKSIIRKNDCLTFLRMFLVFFFVYVLVWLVSSQLLFVLFPVMLLCAIEALPTGSATLKSKTDVILEDAPEGELESESNLDGNEKGQEEPSDAAERDELRKILEEFGEKMPERNTLVLNLFEEAEQNPQEQK